MKTIKIVFFLPVCAFVAFVGGNIFFDNYDIIGTTNKYVEKKTTTIESLKNNLQKTSIVLQHQSKQKDILHHEMVVIDNNIIDNDKKIEQIVKKINTTTTKIFNQKTSLNSLLKTNAQKRRQLDATVKQKEHAITKHNEKLDLSMSTLHNWEEAKSKKNPSKLPEMSLSDYIYRLNMFIYSYPKQKNQTISKTQPKHTPRFLVHVLQTWPTKYEQNKLALKNSQLQQTTIKEQLDNQEQNKIRQIEYTEKSLETYLQKKPALIEYKQNLKNQHINKKIEFIRQEKKLIDHAESMIYIESQLSNWSFEK